MFRKGILMLLACLMLWPLPGARANAQTPSPADPPVFDAHLAAIFSYTLGQSRDPLLAVEKDVLSVQQAPVARRYLAERLAALLDGQASYECKEFVCRQLYLIGTPAEVPALAKLLPDEKLSHMARYALEAIGGPAAAEGLRGALSSLKGNLLIGAVGSLGNLRDAQSAPALKEMLASPDAALASAAAAALGKIGGTESMAALKACKREEPAVRAAVLDARLRCAEGLLADGKGADAAAAYRELRAEGMPENVRTAALRGLVAAEPDKAPAVLVEMLQGSDPALQAQAAAMVALVPGEAATRAFAQALAGLKPAGQFLLIDALAARADPAARSAVQALALSENLPVSAASLRALGALGNASDVALLADMAVKGDALDRGGKEITQAARASLVRLRGADVDAAILAGLKSSTPGVRIELAAALATRSTTSAVPALRDLAEKDAEESVRCAALAALGALGGADEGPPLLARLLAAKADAERDAAKAALIAVGQRAEPKDAYLAPVIAAMPKADPAGQVALVGVLARFGGAPALEAVRTATQDKDSEGVREAATRALTDWPDAAALPDLLKLAEGDNQVHKVLAIRGLMRLIPLTSSRSAEESLVLYRRLLGLCQRAEEKKLVLAGLGDAKEPAAADLCLPFLAEAETRDEAAAAVIKLAQAGRNRTQPQVRAALEKVAASEAAEPLRQQARQLTAGGRRGQ